MNRMSFFSASALSVIQTGLVILVAPVMSGFHSFMSARFAGVAAPPVLRRLYLTRKYWSELSVQPANVDVMASQANVIVAVAATSGITSALVASALVPTSALGLATAPLSDILTITFLLMASYISCQLVLLNGLSETAANTFRGIISVAAIIPVIFLVSVIFFTKSATTNLDVVLSSLRSESPFGDGAPFVLAALALLISGSSSGSDEIETSAQGTDRAMLMLACDSISLVWLTLAGDLLWPGSLVVISESAGILDSLGNLGLGFLLWIVRCIMLCIVLSVSRLIVAGPVAVIRMRTTAALLLLLFAIQIVFGSHLASVNSLGETLQQEISRDHAEGKRL